MRLNAAKTCMMAGDPLTHLDTWRPFIEKYTGSNMTHSKHMRDYVPTIMIEERELITVELRGQFLHFEFDGASKAFCECFVVTVRWVDADMNIHKCLVLVELQRLLKGEIAQNERLPRSANPGKPKCHFLDFLH